MWPVLYLVAGLILVFTFDWCYLFNSYWTILWGLIRAQKPLTDTFSTHVIASFINTDTAFDHLNNAKYIMYLDFARIDFWCRSRLFYLLWRNRNVPLQSATIIRYMKPIQIFASARIDTKLVWWDETMLYLEHKFIVKTRVHSIAMSRVCFERKNVGAILKHFPQGQQPLAYPEHLRPWIEALSVSSTSLSE